MVTTTNRQLPRFLLVLVTSLCSLLLAACGGLGQPQETSGTGRLHVGTDPCNPGVCKVVVTVKNCVIEDIPTISVWSARNIQWIIDSDEQPGYSFAEKGIVIDPLYASDFTHQTGNAKKFILHDKHNIKSPPPIKYTISVVKDSNGAPCPPLDPYISNDF